MPRPKKNRYYYTCERYTYADGSIGFSAVRKMDFMNYSALWCSGSDATFIDGGAIYVNSITANQIASHSITADELNVTNLAALNATVGGFTIQQDWLQYGTWGTDGGFMICPRGTTTTKTIGGHAGKGWAFAIGDQCGITTSGSIYASSVDLTGKITATSGAVANWNIGTDGLSSSGTFPLSGYQHLQGGMTGHVITTTLSNGRIGVADILSVYDEDSDWWPIVIKANGEIFADYINPRQSLAFTQNSGFITNCAEIQMYAPSTTQNEGGRIRFNYNRQGFRASLTGVENSVYAYPAITSGSDRRLKDHIADVDQDKAVALLADMKPVEYTYKDHRNAHHYGFYAQDILKSCGQADIDTSGLIAMVNDPDRDPEVIGDEKMYYTLNYIDLIAFLVKGWQAHEAKIAELQGQLERSA